MLTFAHLQLHSHFSVSEGLCHIPDIAEKAKSGAIFSVALTDVDNMFGWVKFYAQMRGSGVKPIAGADLLLSVDGTYFNISVLCLNNKGYQQLVHLISHAYLSNERVDGRPVVSYEVINQCLDIVVILHARGLEDKLSAKDIKPLQDKLSLFSPLLASRRVFFSLARTGHAREELNQQWASLAYTLKFPMVIANAVSFMRKEDFQAHEIRLCIDQGRVIQDTTREVTHTKEQYFKTAVEVYQLYSDAKAVIENTNQLAKRCNVVLEMGQVYLPEVASDNIHSYFESQVREGLTMRLAKFKSEKHSLEAYEARLKREINTINEMGFASYFLIVADFIKWSKGNQVPVGPGRGSGAGSLAAYALEITDIDPLEYDLLFERFLNPERVSMPDFDIDFCMVGRDRVIDYVSNKYGRLNVSQIITYGRMAAKAVIRDVGRVLGHPYGFVDKLAKLIPFDIGITLDKAMVQEPMLAKRYADETEVRQIIDYCKVLEGLVRNVGTHAGGVVIAPSEISDYSPTYCADDQASIVTQYDKDDIEKIGLVKFDFLGLRTLTIIDWALDNIKRSIGQDIDITSIPLDDKKAFALLQACKTTGVFQLESQGMKDLIDRLVPDCFEDIVALVALYRPGPLQSGMVDDFVKRKHGIDEVSYQHPRLEPILNNTYGVILYQEQVMQIAQDLAGYSLGSADLLRRAMGKKKPEEMEKQRTIFSEGAEKEKIDKKVATEIFDLMEKFAGYGFNKSHSAAYALISYQTAWLKANYPTEFMAAVLSSDMDNTDKVIIFLEDVKSLGIKVLPPDVNHSQSMFSVVEDGVIRYGLSAVKGVGQSAAEQLVQSRPKEGFQSLLDVCASSDKVNKKMLESLIKSGACDVFGQNRATLLASIELATQTNQQRSSNASQGQMDLLGEEETFTYKQANALPKSILLQQEKDSLGYYLSGHPVAECRNELLELGVKPIQLVSSSNTSVRIAGVVNKTKVIKTKKGGRIAFVELSDDSGKMDVAFFDEVYTACYELLSKPGVIIIEGTASLDQFTQKTRIQCLKATSLESHRMKLAPVLEISLSGIGDTFVKDISAYLSEHKGKSKVVMIYQNENGKATFTLPSRVSVCDELIEKISVMDGVSYCRLNYKYGVEA